MHVTFPGHLPTPGEPSPFGRPAPTELEDAVRGRLFQQRIVLLAGHLDDVTASQAVAELMTLDATGDTPVHLHLDCGGGSLDAAFAVIDTIDLCGVEVRVTCLGRAEGVAIGVLAAGHHREASEHARIHLCDPELVVEGRGRDIAAHAAAAMSRVTALHERVAQATRRPLAKVEADFRDGRWMSADEALSYGLVDQVAGRDATIRAIAARRIGFRPPGRR